MLGCDSCPPADIWLSSVDLDNPAALAAPTKYEAVPLEEIEKRHILATLGTQPTTAKLVTTGT